MTTTSVEVLDPAAAQRRYDALVASIASPDEFRSRGLAFDLDVRETALYDELRELEFLLGRD